ncbi:MAG: hypothetical protein ABIR56_02005 [Polaromonas sp.]
MTRCGLLPDLVPGLDPVAVAEPMARMSPRRAGAGFGAGGHDLDPVLPVFAA